MKIIENKKIARETYKMVLEPREKEKLGKVKPGQFINIKVHGFYLRRPISISDWNENTLTIIYKTVGSGTKAMSDYEKGKTLDVLWPLGNGYDVEKIQEDALLIGGGVGVPPIYGLAKKLVENKKKLKVVLGFKSKEDIFLEEDFENLIGSENLEIVTDDGSSGHKGLVTDIYQESQYTCGCGSEPMLKAIWEKSKDGQYSFEARMGCGFGGCMGCSCETITGNKRICKEGPILSQEEIIWK